MDSEKELISKIAKRLQRIRRERPELSQYLDEMPMTLPNESDPEVTLQKLEEYYESLRLLEKKQTR